MMNISFTYVDTQFNIFVTFLGKYVGEVKNQRKLQIALQNLISYIRNSFRDKNYQVCHNHLILESRTEGTETLVSLSVNDDNNQIGDPCPVSQISDMPIKVIVYRHGPVYELSGYYLYIAALDTNGTRRVIIGLGIFRNLFSQFSLE